MHAELMNEYSYLMSKSHIYRDRAQYEKYEVDYELLNSANPSQELVEMKSKAGVGSHEASRS